MSPPVSESQLEKGAKILAKAREVARTMDAEKINMRILADACGVSIPTLYNRFKDKDNLLTTALDEVLRLHFEQIDLKDDEPLLEQLVRMADGTTEVLLANRELGRWMFKVTPATPSHSGYLLGKELYRSCLERMKASGEIDDRMPISFLTDRLYYRLRGTALEWTLGNVSDQGFQHLRRCEIAILLLSVSRPPLTEKLHAMLEREQPLVA